MPQSVNELTFPQLDLSYCDSLRVILPGINELNLVLIGCGGTGSWLAPAVVRVAKILDGQGNAVTVTFVDGDLVEEANIYRQNFCAAEIGMFKSEALALRYGTAWGVEIAAIRRFYRSGDLKNHYHTLIIGCVDNADARKAIAETEMSGFSAWLDCGNEKNSGQVLLGLTPGAGTKMNSPFDLPGYCAWLPSPAVQHPELIAPGRSIRSIDFDPGVSDLEFASVASAATSQQAPLQSGNNYLSCAEMAMQDSQGLSINQRMAAEAADYLVRLLITHDLRKYATYIDLEAGVTRSEYVTEERIRQWMKK